MYTGFRSIVLCEEIRQGLHAEMSLQNLFGDPLKASSRPGVVLVAMALTIETDRQWSLGTLTLECKGMQESFPLETPADRAIASAYLLLPVPVLEEGDLVMTVANSGDDGAPSFSKAWGLGFAKNAAEAADRGTAEAEIIAQVREKATTMRRGLLLGRDYFSALGYVWPKGRP